MPEPVRAICPIDGATASEVRVTGNNGDLIEYWSGGERWFNDEIRDGNDLRCGSDVVSFPGSDRGARSCFAVRHGRERDLVRLYAPQGPGLRVFLFEREPFRQFFRIRLEFQTPTIVRAFDGQGPNVIRTYRLIDDNRWEAQ
jgi:hypothetical protein